jgi:hypothetical protein
MTETSDLVVFWAVVAARFFVPFAIPRYPLPGVLACLIIDGIDQTIFQTFTNLRLDNYQGYDKALDVYYLTITYISTLRNWTNLFAFNLDKFFFYYRLFGVTVFELIQFRPLLMIFPNTFEYFFIFYGIVRLKWDPRRLSRLDLIGAAALIWILIKLPQEYIIHIAQVDTTDWIKMNVLRIPADGSTSGATLFLAGLIVVLVALVGLLFFAVRWLKRRLPAADWGLSFSADANLASKVNEHEPHSPTQRSERFFSIAFVEKIALVSGVGIIFAQVLPDIRASGFEISIGGAILIIMNTALSQWLAGHGIGRTAGLRNFIVMIVVNFVLILVIAILLPSYDGSINLVNVIFFTLLFTVIVTMIDSYRQVHLKRFATTNIAAPDRKGARQV